jgi:hypothetical protein
MPFTLSHVAAVLPVHRWTTAGRGPLIASALAFGAMAPDVVLFTSLEFLPLQADRQGTHRTLAGVFIVDLALTAALVAAFHLLRGPVLALLPDSLRGRIEEPLRPRNRPSPATVVFFVLSAWAGILTHLGWDMWTHSYDYGAAEIAPVLQEEAFWGRRWTEVLQHTSTVTGLVVLAVWSWRTVKKLPELPVRGLWLPVRVRVLAAAGILAAGALVAVKTALPLPADLFKDAEVVGFDVATGFGRGLAVALLAYAVLSLFMKKLSRRP